jgi:alpha-galactosidase
MTQQEWHLVSPSMQRDVAFEDGRGLRTDRWTNRSTGTNLLQPLEHGAPEWNMEFSFVIDGRTTLSSRSPDLHLVSSRHRDDSLTVLLEAQGIAIEVTYTVYDRHPVLRKGLTIHNRRQEPIVLTHLIVESLELCVGHPDEQALFTFYGVQPREMFVSGRVDDPVVYQRNVRTGEGFVAMNEVPGIMKRIDTSWTWQGGIQLMYDTDVFPFERRVAPNETFTTAHVGIAFTQDGTESAPQRVIPAYTSDILHPKGSRFRAPWIYNTWEHFFRDIDHTSIASMIPLAGRMGFDIFTLDDGWQAMMGSNDVRASHFPDGLDDIQQMVEENGMRLGLWFALAVVDAEDPPVREHPEWMCWDGRLRPRQTLTMSGSAPVMCLATPYRDVVTEQIAQAVRMYDLAYVKLDLTTVFNAYGEGPGCFAPGHEHASWAESLIRSYESIHAITASLHAQIPELLIDLTFELWGQKHVIDYGLLASGDLDWLSNVHDLGAAGPRQARTLLYHRSLAIPADTMLIGNLRADIEPIAERFATAIGSAPLLLGDLRQLSPDQVSWYRAKIDWFKDLRQEIPIQQSFFPLGAWMHPNAAQWDGYARLSHDGEGMIVLFRNACRAREASVSIPMFGSGRCVLTSVMTGDLLATVPAEDFQQGVTLPLVDDVEIIEVRRTRD